MKAIIQVKKGSAFAHLNGHTFPVKSLFTTGVSVTGATPEFPNNQTDFAFNEVVIVDIQEEMAKKDLSDCKLSSLYQYCHVNNIKY